MYNTILYQKEEGIGLVTLNRPAALNALNSEVFSELAQVFDEIGRDNDVKAVIMTGAGGRAFAAGADIAEMVKYGSVEARGFVMLGKKACDKIYRLDKPVIAAISGFALGGGLEVAMCCDFRIASDNSRFGQPEINLAIIPGAGGTQRLPRLVGATRAKELVFTGDMIDAKTALDWGLVNRVVPADKVMEEARNFAKKLMSKSSIALTLAKNAVNDGTQMDLDNGLLYEIQCFAQAFATEDHKEGIEAFLQKRKASFKGK